MPTRFQADADLNQIIVLAVARRVPCESWEPVQARDAFSSEALTAVGTSIGTKRSAANR
jgi:hypothetical protein